MGGDAWRRPRPLGLTVSLKICEEKSHRRRATPSVPSLIVIHPRPYGCVTSRSEGRPGGGTSLRRKYQIDGCTCVHTRNECYNTLY